MIPAFRPTQFKLNVVEPYCIVCRACRMLQGKNKRPPAWFIDSTKYDVQLANCLECGAFDTLVYIDARTMPACGNLDCDATCMNLDCKPLPNLVMAELKELRMWRKALTLGLITGFFIGIIAAFAERFL